MTAAENSVRCAIKEYRRRRGLSQEELAQLIGVRRQAVYDMESGRYLPNTGVALKLARILNCTVEMLFVEEAPAQCGHIRLLGNADATARLALAQVRDMWVGVPLGAGNPAPFRVDASDGFLSADKTVDCLLPREQLGKTILIHGCDPALGILGGLMGRMAPGIRVHTVFASSRQALSAIREGYSHVAGIHYSGSGTTDGNIEAVRSLAAGMECRILAFSVQEEGIMIGPGNPLRIRTVDDLASGGIRFVNREEGAALRKLLDTQLAQRGIPCSAIQGYADEVRSHSEGAGRVAHGSADAALGLRIVAESFGLDFVPLASTRYDLAIPSDLYEHPGITVLLDVLQSSGIRRELGALPGYEASVTGKSILG